MLPVKSYEKFLELLKSRYGKNERIVCILFLDPCNDDLVSGYISHRFDYFNYRLGERLDFFCPGFNYLEHDNKRREFDTRDFVEFIRQIEQLTTWHYYGGTNLLLLKYSNYELHFNSVYDLNLSRMMIDGYITDYRYFLEDLIHNLQRDVELFFDNNCTRQYLTHLWNNFSDLLPTFFRGIINHVRDSVKIEQYFTPKDIRIGSEL